MKTPAKSLAQKAVLPQLNVKQATQSRAQARRRNALTKIHGSDARSAESQSRIAPSSSTLSVPMHHLHMAASRQRWAHKRAFGRPFATNPRSHKPSAILVVVSNVSSQPGFRRLSPGKKTETREIGATIRTQPHHAILVHMARWGIGKRDLNCMCIRTSSTSDSRHGAAMPN